MERFPRLTKISIDPFYLDEGSDMKQNISPQKDDTELHYRKCREKEVQLDGVTYQVNLFLPTKGTGSLESRLLRLMEQELEREKRGYFL